MPHLPRAKRQQQRKPTSNQAFYNSRTWRNIRASYLLENPLCEICLAAGVLNDCTSGSPIDHIIPISQGGSKYDPQNLMTQCESCHARKSRMEADGFCLKKTLTAPNCVPAFGERGRLIEILKLEVR